MSDKWAAGSEAAEMTAIRAGRFSDPPIEPLANCSERPKKLSAGVLPLQARPAIDRMQTKALPQ